MTASRAALLTSACALALSACNSTGTSREFFKQEYSDAALAAAFEAAANGERISITQHTGQFQITAPSEDSEAFEALLVDLFLSLTPEDMQLAYQSYLEAGGDLGLDVTADGEDKNPTYFQKGDPSTINIVSVGTADFVEGADVGDGVALLNFEQLDRMGDPTAEVLVLATIPNEVEGEGLGFDYMSLVGWMSIEEENLNGLGDRAGDLVGVDVTLDFGVGHVGLATPLNGDGEIEGALTAYYQGPFVGFFVVPGATGGDGFGLGAATGDAILMASFTDATVEGYIDDLWATALNLENGEVIEDSLGADIGIEALIEGNTYAGTATVLGDAEGLVADGSSGPVDGGFYGPVDTVDGSTGPAETGAVLTIYDADGTGNVLTGVIGGKLTAPPDI